LTFQIETKPVSVWKKERIILLGKTQIIQNYTNKVFYIFEQAAFFLFFLKKEI